MQTYETDVTSVSNTPLAVITLTWQSCKREQGIFQVATWQGIEGSRSGKGIFISGELMQCKRLTEHIWWKPQPSWKPVQTTAKKSSKFIKKITRRWYDDTQPCKISCPNSTLFVRYKNNKFLTNHLDSFLAWNFLFLHVWFFVEFRQLFYRGLHGFSRRLWFPSDMFPRYGLTLIYLCIY